MIELGVNQKASIALSVGIAYSKMDKTNNIAQENCSFCGAVKYRGFYCPECHRK